jgi:hypothetical protein
VLRNPLLAILPTLATRPENTANMKRQMINTISILLLIGCNNIDYKPKYKDFANSLERENLIGKVKKLEQFKANVTDIETSKTDNPIIEFKKEFTESGNISYKEQFDNFGTLEQYDGKNGQIDHPRPI